MFNEPRSTEPRSTEPRSTILVYFRSHPQNTVNWRFPTLEESWYWVGSGIEINDKGKATGLRDSQFCGPTKDKDANYKKIENKMKTILKKNYITYYKIKVTDD